MYKFDKILVALDNSQMDEELIKSAEFISSLSETKEVHFINVIKDFDTPENLLKQFPNLIEGALKDRQAGIATHVKKYFNEENGPLVLINVIKGHILKELLSYSAKTKSDLIIVGRKNERKGGGVLNTRLARRASCSLMIIPSESAFRVENVLVPVDFSEHSTLALELAVRIARKTGAKITTQNVYQVPVGYHYTGKSKTEFAAIMEKHAGEAFEKLCKKLDLNGINIEQLYTQSHDEHIMEDVYKIANKISADSIIIGAKGRTAATALFIGSKAEKLIQMDEKFPLLVVRPKGKNAGIIEYLKEL